MAVTERRELSLNALKQRKTNYSITTIMEKRFPEWSEGLWQEDINWINMLKELLNFFIVLHLLTSLAPNTKLVTLISAVVNAVDDFYNNGDIG